MNENRCKHLELIQGVVNRLSTNSFLLKGWTVVLVSALFALAAKDAKIVFAYLAYFPAFTFWLLDGYFLWQERLYRNGWWQDGVVPQPVMMLWLGLCLELKTQPIRNYKVILTSHSLKLITNEPNKN